MFTIGKWVEKKIMHKWLNIRMQSYQRENRLIAFALQQSAGLFSSLQVLRRPLEPLSPLLAQFCQVLLLFQVHQQCSVRAAPVANLIYSCFLSVFPALLLSSPAQTGHGEPVRLELPCTATLGPSAKLQRESSCWAAAAAARPRAASPLAHPPYDPREKTGDETILLRNNLMSFHFYYSV